MQIFGFLSEILQSETHLSGVVDVVQFEHVLVGDVQTRHFLFFLFTSSDQVRRASNEQNKRPMGWLSGDQPCPSRGFNC